MMGRLWLGFCFFGFCFMLRLFNSSASCETDYVRNVETERVVKNAESSLRVEKGIGCVKQSNVRLPIQSTKPVGLNDRKVGLGQRRVLKENMSRTDTGDGFVNAPKERKRVGSYRKERASLKQSTQKNVKGVQNYNTTKEGQRRRSNRGGDLFKRQEERSKMSRAQSGLYRRKEESSNDDGIENGMNLNKTGGESKRDKLRTRVKGKRQVTNLTWKKQKEEEESPNSAIEVNKEENNDGIIDEAYKNKGLQNGIKGKRPAFESIPQVERKEDEEDQNSPIREKKEKNGGEHDEKEYKKKGLQNEVKNKRIESKSIGKDEREDEYENGDGAIQESNEKSSDGDSEEAYKRKGLQSKVKRKRRVSKSMEKDEKQEEEEDINAVIQDNKEKDSEEYNEQEYKRKGSKNKINVKGSTSISVHKDEEEQEEDLTASKENKDREQDTEEEYKKAELHNEVNRKRQASKLTNKEVKQNEYPNDLIPESKEKKDSQDSDEESNKNELQGEVKEQNSVLHTVATYEKNVNDDGFELAEEILSLRDQSASESLDNTKDDGESIKGKSEEHQDSKDDQAELDVAISDKQNKRRNGKGNAIATQMPLESSEDESSEGEIEDDEIESRANSKFSQSETDDREASTNFDSEGDNQSDEDSTDKESKANIRDSEETEVEYADDDMKKESKSKTVPTNKQSKSIFQNPEEQNADEFEDDDVKEQNRFKRVSTKKQSTSDFANAEEENVDESVDNDVMAENGSGTVPNNKQSQSNLSNAEEETADESIDVKGDNEFEMVQTKKKSKYHPQNTEEDNADEMDLKLGEKSETVPDQKQSQSKFSVEEDINKDESLKDESKEDASSETTSNDKQSSFFDTKESSANSTEEEFGDFIQEFSDLPSKFQDTAEKVADKLIPEIQKFSNKSKVYFNRANEGITQGFRPLIGNKYAPFFASMISYILVLIPLIVVIVLFDQIRTYFPLQKAILYANIYLAAYFGTLILANFLIGMEPMGFFFRNSASSYTYLQLLEALGYLLYLFLQFMNLIMSFSKLPFSSRLAAILQCVVSIFIGLHYYVTVFHRAMAQKAPRTNWKIYAVNTVAFFVLCLFSKIKHGKKQYTQVQDSSGASKKH